MNLSFNKIVIKLASPLIINQPLIKLDALIKAYETDTKPFVAQSFGIYHISFGRITKINTTGVSIIKDVIDPANLPCQPVKTMNIDIGTGVWQTYKRSLYHHVIDEIEFYAQADSKQLYEFIKHLGFLGDFTHLGFGEIKEVIITPTDHDYSFVKDGRLMRSVPAGVDIGVDFGDEPLNPLTYSHALDDCYLDDSLVSCYIPN